MAIDLEERIARLEAQVEAKLELDQLQREFAVLQSNPTIKRLLNLMALHPSAFRAAMAPAWTSPAMDMQDKIDVVLGHASQIAHTAAQSSKLPNMTIPSLQTSQLLADHTDQLAQLREIAHKQDSEIETLIRRTVTLMDNWYTQLVRPVNAAMVDLDRKLSSVTREMRRSEQESD